MEHEEARRIIRNVMMRARERIQNRFPEWDTLHGLDAAEVEEMCNHFLWKCEPIREGTNDPTND